MSAKYKSPSFLLPNELNTSANPANDTGVNSLYSMDFGSNEYINLGNPEELRITGAITISLWFNSTASTGGFVTKSDNGAYFAYPTNKVYELGILNNTLNWTISDGTTAIACTPSMSSYLDGNWHHLMATWDGTTNARSMKVFLDGLEVFDRASTISSIQNKANDVVISSKDSLWDFTGKIDEVAIWNSDQTDNISNIYNSGSPSNLIASNLNPVAYYPLGEQAQNTGYLTQEVTNGWQFPNGVLQDYVMDFNAANYISTSHISLSSAFSVSAWVNTTDTSTYGNIFSSDQAPVGGAIRNWQLVRFNATARFILRNSSGVSIADAYDLNVVINDGKWHHILATWDGTTGTNKVKIYIDGDLAAQDTASSTSLRNDTVLMIMGGSSATWDFIGKISSVALWNSDQSTNIANIYNNGSPQTSYTVSPQNWWKLNATSVYTPSTPNYTKALEFDGANVNSDYISVPSSLPPSGTSNFALSGWFYRDSNSSIASVYFDKVSGTNFLVREAGLSGTIEIFAGGTNYNYSSLSTYNTANAWHHIAISYDGSNLTVYVDTNKLSQSATGLNISSTSDMRIGARAGNQSGSFFKGFISNVAVYNTNLTDSNVSTLFNFGTPETTPSFSPQAWWKLDDQNAITDSSGNGNTGTNNGATDISSGVAVTPSWKIPSALTIPSINYTKSLSFNGSSSYIDLPSQSTLEPSSNYTFSIWFNSTGNQYSSLIGTSVGISKGITLLYASSVLKWYHVESDGSNNVFEISLSGVNTGDWANVTVTWDSTSGNIRAFVNKVYVNGASNVSDIDWGSSFLRLGFYSPNNWYYSGKLSNSVIWNTTLTDDFSGTPTAGSVAGGQVAEIYNNGQPQTSITGSPVGWWKLDDQNTITDYSGNNYTGTNNGAVDATGDVTTSDLNIPVNGVSTTLPSTALQQSDLQFDSPYSNYSLSFDGTGDYIDCTDNDMFSFGNGTTDSPFSVSMWVNFSNLTTNCLYSKRNTNTDQEYGITQNSSSIEFLIRRNLGGDGYAYVTCNTSLSTGVWYHVVTTYDGSGGSSAINGMKIYVDGVENTQVGATSNYTAMSNTSYPFRIGKLETSSSTYDLNGKVDETAIFNTELTSSQVLEIYNNGRPKDLTTFSGTAPISWWRLGENAYFDNNSFVVPNSISGAPNGTGSGTITTMISADAPGTYANGVGTNLDILDRVGDAPLSTSNSQSYNIIPSDISPYVPQYVGKQIANNFSMTFDGTNYFTASSKFDFIQQTAIFSISTWIKMSDNTSATNQVIAGTNYTGSNVGWQLWIDNRSSQSPAVNKTLKFHLWNSATNLLAIDQVITDNDWNLITITGDGTTIRAYKNGSLLSTTQSISGSTSSTAFSDLRIGANTVSSPSVFFNGQIDEVAIFDTALNAGQIYNDIYQPTASAPGNNQTADLVNNPNLPNPVAWYRMGD